MTEEKSSNHNVVKEQQTLAQAIDTLIDIHRADAGNGPHIDFGVEFMCRNTILNIHESAIRDAWDEFYSVYNVDTMGA